MLLDKAGNSNTAERIDLMEQFYALFPTVELRCITTDREFIGGPWFSYLLLALGDKLKTPFRARRGRWVYIAATRLEDNALPRTT